MIAFLSYVSFSAYLFHRIVFELVKHMVWPTHEWAQWLELLTVGLPMVLVTSALIQTGYDSLIASPTFNRRNAVAESSSQ